MNISFPAVRALGCLMEKKMATPEYYPLSLNALVNACNQKTSRTPVVAYDEETVREALAELKNTQLIWRSEEGRVTKYGENFTGLRKMTSPEAAVLCVLLLRGPQTIGELRSRTDRLHKFESLEDVKQSLDELGEMKLAMELPRAPGQKEQRFAHLLSGETEQFDEEAETGQPPLRPPNEIKETVQNLVSEVAELKNELAELKINFAEFRKQFE